jgi:putative peptidoglycan lipid II flippase
MIALAVNMTLNVLLVLPAFYWFGFEYPHVLLATSTCISAAVNSVLLLRGLRRAKVYAPSRGWPAFLSRVILANLVMAAVLVFLAGPLEPWTSAPAMERAGHLGVCIVAGAIAYFAALAVTGLRPRHVRTL